MQYAKFEGFVTKLENVTCTFAEIFSREKLQKFTKFVFWNFFLQSLGDRSSYSLKATKILRKSLKS